MTREQRRGFTLVELMATIVIIFLVMALLIAGIHHVMGGVRKNLDRATVKSLQNGVTQFNQTFGFFPPLVMDGYAPGFTQGPLAAGRPVIYSFSGAAAFLQTAPPGPGPNTAADLRFSLYSLPYYVLGVLDVDGVPGPGFRGVRRDGSFETAGRTFGPYFDVSKNAKAVVENPAASGRFELRDGHEIAFRYYRWIRGDSTGQVASLANLNIPWMVGDPSQTPELRNAEYAIVSAGPNGLFGDEDLLPPTHPQHVPTPNLQAMANKLGGSWNFPADEAKFRAACMADNIVEVGR